MPVEGRPHGEHGTAAEQARAPDSRGERAGAESSRDPDPEDRAPSSGLHGVSGLLVSGPRVSTHCLALLAFSSPAVKFDCFPGACKKKKKNLLSS